MPVQSITLQGILAAMAVVANLAAVLWPGPGQFVAGFSCLPVALAAMADRRQAPLGAAAALLLTIIFSLKQGLIFGLLNLPLGLMTGTGLASGRPRWLVVTWTAAVVAVGLLLLSLGAGFPILGTTVQKHGKMVAVAAYISFGFVYSWAWVDFLQRLQHRLAPVLNRHRI